MEDKDVIISELRDELAGLKKRVAELEKGPTEPKKQMAEKLRESEERYKTLVDTSIDMIFTVDLKGNFIVTNPAFERILGYSKEEILKINGFELIHPEDLKQVQDQFAGLLEGKSVDNMEYRYKTKKGSYIWILNNASPVFDSSGKIVAAMGVARNITDRKRSEEELRKYSDHLEDLVAKRTHELQESNDALRKSEKLYSNVVENTKDVISISQDGIVKFINRAAKELIGYEPEEMVNRNMMEFIAPEYYELVAKRYEDRLSGKDVPNIYEINILKKDGSTLSVEVNTTLINYGDGPASLVYARDITQRKNAEEKIKKSLEEKEMLLKEVHHRVKNNLQIISSLLSLQSKKIKDKRVLDMFEKSRSRVRSMALIHEKLYQSKDFTEIDYAGYIENLAKYLSQVYVIDTDRIEFKFNIEKVSLKIDKGVPCGLIINELISNALQHAFPPSFKGEGKVEVTVQMVDEDEIELIVKDNGVGISKDLNIHKTESLGLYLVRMLSEEQLNGKLELDRAEGTKISIVFKI